jgi:hypothetical protein
MISAEPSPRARFWRRVFAFIIDGCAVGAVIAAIGIPLFSLTDGRIRVANTLVNYSMCAGGTALPAGLDLPADFNVTHVVHCTRYFFGVVHDRTLTVREVTRSGSLTYTRSITFSADAAGRPSEAFYLDYLWIFILACYRIVSEWKLGTTLGKHLLRMRVQPVGGGPMTATGALTRTLVCFIPMYPFALLMVLLIALGPTGLFAMGHYFFAVVFVGLVLTVVFLLNFILAVRRARLPWHDRWAGTEVVRGR